MRRERHCRQDREHVDDDGSLSVDESDRGAETRERADEVDDDQDPLPSIAIPDDGDERRHERARDHAREQHEADGSLRRLPRTPRR